MPFVDIVSQVIDDVEATAFETVRHHLLKVDVIDGVAVFKATA